MCPGYTCIRTISQQQYPPSHHHHQSQIPRQQSTFPGFLAQQFSVLCRVCPVRRCSYMNAAKVMIHLQPDFVAQPYIHIGMIYSSQLYHRRASPPARSNHRRHGHTPKHRRRCLPPRLQQLLQPRILSHESRDRLCSIRLDP